MPDAPTILAVLWRASWQAGVLALLVLALRYTLRDRLPAAWRSRLWGLVFLRLLLPAVPASPLSLFNLLPPDPPLPAVRWPTVTVVVQAQDTTPFDATPAAPMPAAESRPSHLPDALLAAWLGTATALAIATVVAHVRFGRRIRRSQLPVPPEVAAAWRTIANGRRVPPLVVTDAVSSPALFGLLRGRLLLPPDLWGRLSPAELRLVFQHELAHVRRRDLLVGWVAVLIRCVYWFHPLVWIAVAARRADAEGACDDAVVAATGDRLGYGRTLLAVAGGRRVPAIGMADGRTDLRRRLARVASGRRPGPWTVAVAAGLTAAVGCATLTGAKPSDNVTRTYKPFIPYEPVEPVAKDGSSQASYFSAGPPLAAARPRTPADMTDLVRKAVTPEVWHRSGTAIAFEGRDMRVTAPPDTQAGVVQLLADLDRQVSVETRIMSVRADQVRSAGITLPDVGVVQPVTDDQVGSLVRAVEQDRGSSILTAPRLTTFTGQVAQLIVETKQAYVSDLTPIFAPGGTSLLDPTVSTVPAVGVEEWVRSTVTADGRAVDLTARLEMRRLVSMEAVDVAYTRGGQTVHGNLQLPHTDVTRAELSVRLASGQTVLLRGAESDTYGSGKAATHPSTAPVAGDRLTVVLFRPTVLRRLTGQQRTFPLLPVPAAQGGPSTRSTSPKATAAVRLQIGDPLHASDYAGLVMARVPPRVSGPFPVTRGVNGYGGSIMAAALSPFPGTPTPDGRGGVIPIPTDLSGNGAKLIRAGRPTIIGVPATEPVAR